MRTYTIEKLDFNRFIPNIVCACSAQILHNMNAISVMTLYSIIQTRKMNELNILSSHFNITLKKNSKINLFIDSRTNI